MPNPGNGVFQIKANGAKSINIYDIAGRHLAIFDGDNAIFHADEGVASGIYFAEAIFENVTLTNRFLLLR
jgi:hypothetical protein